VSRSQLKPVIDELKYLMPVTTYGQLAAMWSRHRNMLTVMIVAYLAHVGRIYQSPSREDLFRLAHVMQLRADEDQVPATIHLSNLIESLLPLGVMDPPPNAVHAEAENELPIMELAAAPAAEGLRLSEQEFNWLSVDLHHRRQAYTRRLPLPMFAIQYGVQPIFVPTLNFTTTPSQTAVIGGCLQSYAPQPQEALTRTLTHYDHRSLHYAFFVMRNILTLLTNPAHPPPGSIFGQFFDAINSLQSQYDNRRTSIQFSEARDREEMAAAHNVVVRAYITMRMQQTIRLNYFESEMMGERRTLQREESNDFQQILDVRDELMYRQRSLSFEQDDSMFLECDGVAMDSDGEDGRELPPAQCGEQM
jgi:hypothetical protein